MLQLDRGRAMGLLTKHLEELGFTWAYRVVDTRAFGLPHRRKRVIFLASMTHDPRGVLLNQDAGEPMERDWRGRANGFYWTEGLRGVGWAVDSVPTLKCGSTLSIPSPPAIWLPEGSCSWRFVTPTIEDAERLQGFPKGWTDIDTSNSTMRKARWRMVGNAVSVPVANWVGQRLRDMESYRPVGADVDLPRSSWPKAAWGNANVGRFASSVSEWPVRQRPKSLIRFIGDLDACTPLSERASRGFLDRLLRGGLKVGGARDMMIDSLREHLSDLR
jgi:DNA (cytosine-5)-methyltransferase 1